MTREILLEIANSIPNKDNNYRELLYAVAKEMNVIVELGTYMGITAKGLADSTSGKVYAYDIWNETKNYISQDPRPNLFYTEGDSIQESKKWKGEIDMLFIDAEHNYENTMGNYLAWKDHVKEGGIIFFDDTELDTMIKVKQELDLIPLNEFHWSGFSAIIK